MGQQARRSRYYGCLWHWFHFGLPDHRCSRPLSGLHWIFHPEASEHNRIVEERVSIQYTRFRLPWAFEISQVRKELGISQVDKSKLDDFAAEESEVIGNAALLKQVNHLEVKRSGKSLRRIQTVREGDLLLVEDEFNAVRWRILEGDFSAAAATCAKGTATLEKTNANQVSR